MQNPDWGLQAEARAYIQDLEYIIAQLQISIDQTGLTLDEGPFRDKFLLEIKWEFGVTADNVFRQGWAPHTDAELQAIIAQPNGYLSGNLLTIQSILHCGLNDVNVPSMYDVFNPLYPSLTSVYIPLKNKLATLIGKDKIEIPVDNLHAYLYSLIYWNLPE